MTHFRANILFVQRPDYHPARVDSFFEAPDQLAGNERFWLVLDSQVPPLGYPGSVDPLRPTAYQNGVLVPLGREQPETRSFSLDQPVHRDGRRVANDVD